jgi:ribose 5-phosphate isomerase B
MSIALASDHAGFPLKEHVKGYLQSTHRNFVDFGPDNAKSVDYPDFGAKVAYAVSKGQVERGILICGSGLGMSILANRFPDVRAALCDTVEIAQLARLHNNANILVMGGRILSHKDACNIVEAWLTTKFEGGRHQKRIEKIEALTKKIR